MALTMNELMPRLRNAHVRALAWLIGSPGLLDAEHESYRGYVVSDERSAWMLANAAPWLLELDALPEELTRRVAEGGSRRLGRYAEILLTRYWLDGQSRMPLLSSNLAVRREVGGKKETLGEVDFLLHDPRYNRVAHWEMAVKFYLLADAKQGLNGFVGTNTEDRLARKISKVFKNVKVDGHVEKLLEAVAKG